MTALQLLKDEVKNARELFEGTVGDVTSDQLQTDLGGKSLPLGATYAHLIFSEDVIVSQMLQGKTPLFETTFKGQTGTDQPMPAMDENWSEANEKWSKSVQVNLDQLREYSKGVYQSTDDYLNSLNEEDLDKEVDLGAWGKKSIAEMLYGFIAGHTYSLAGEISALKGVQGFKGYPF